ncbi:LysM peptidoglycan-binding domain-containing protein [Microlunatus sp. GCM10028923]|uniref:LysM peptidoglycan-binding domain-containing protein n=1 Tax=Microlunatus sp. GCM10028923 TaxID=3273400 RepID=UPI00360EF4EF
MPTHRVDRADDLWSLADRYYGDRSAWRLILEANRGVLRDENTPLRPGLLLIIPLNAEDAAGWSDVTDDEYGVEREQRINVEADPYEELLRLGFIDEDVRKPGADRRQRLKLWGALIASALLLIILLLCGAVALFQG